MLAIHWSPVNKTKTILKQGIRKNKNGLYCFPLTGNHYVDKFWVGLLNSTQKKTYNGFIFKMTESDMPVYFGDWLGATNKDRFAKEIKTLKDLKSKYRDNFLYKIGLEMLYSNKLQDIVSPDNVIDYAVKEIKKGNSDFYKRLTDISFLDWCMENLQIVISNSIKPNRIIKVIGQGDKIGRIQRIDKKERIADNDTNKYLP